jgi:hypothetical protein
MTYDNAPIMEHMTPEKIDTSDIKSQPKTGLPEIHARESHRKYKLIDLDNSEMERTAAELFEGTKLLKNRELWIANFGATIARVRRWSQEKSEKLRISLVDVRSNKVMFYFVPQSDRYDLELGDEMTALEVELGGGAGIGYVETLQVPGRSLDRFAGVNSRTVWERAESLLAQ